MTTPKSVDLAISASWIIPVIPRDRVLHDCALIIDNGKIEAICPKTDIGNKYLPEQEIHLDGQALIPGLINAHGHAAMTLFRGMADDKPLQEWLEQYIWPAEQRWVSEEFVRDGTELAMAEMIKSGTTCFADMYFFPEESAAAVFESGMRAQINFPVLDFPTPWASNAEEYIHKGLALHDNYRTHELITVGFGPHAPYTVSDEPLKKIVTYAEELQAPIHIHLHETAFEVSSSIEQHGVRPIERLHQLGVLSPLTQCVHMTQINEDDLTLLKTTGAHIVHCPASNLKLASGLCPVEKLVAHDINVSLGTDGAASNNDLDMFDEMKNAALIGKITANNAAAVNAMTTLELATINGAKAMGLEHKIGSLEPGKDADLTAIDLSGLQQQPLFDPISQLVYTQVGHKVSHAWVKGKCLLENYKLKTLSENDLKQKARKWQTKLAQQT
ncbi:5-methylthioadenosine/S-adenosylhomocysteine deaminase [Thalassocella blandensis]|nr:5-methylthioadenosine/S-adenosylhomocysteine deaminase [Thalassocella blandensis]